MLRAQMGRELVIRVPDEIGVLAKTAKVLSDKAINIQALCAAGDGQGEMRLVVDDHERALEALRGKGYDAGEAPVVRLEAEHRCGVLRRLAERLAESGINIRRVYGSATAGAEESLIVLDSEDNERAMVLLND